MSVRELTSLLAPDDSLAIAEMAHLELASGLALAPPGQGLASGRGGLQHVLRIAQCVFPPGGVAGVLASSRMVEVNTYAGRPVADLAPGAAPADHLLLFDLATGGLLAMLDAEWLAGYARALAAILAASRLVPCQACAVGLLGTGQQARLQLELLSRVRTVREVSVYSPVRSRTVDFASNASRALGLDVRPVLHAGAAVEGHDAVLCATSSPVPVFDASQVAKGMHVSGTRTSELPAELLRQADVCIVPTTEPPDNRSLGGAGRFWQTQDGKPSTPRLSTLAEVLSGSAKARTSPKQITVFAPLFGYGSVLLMTALGAMAVDRAGLGGPSGLSGQWQPVDGGM